MLIKHIYDELERTPVATVACVGPDLIGVSVCCPKDHFNKKRGREIAVGRAAYGVVPKIPNRSIYTVVNDKDEFYLDFLPLEIVVRQEISRMRVRAAKYFQ